MIVHLAQTGIPMERSCVPAFAELRAADRFGIHQLTDDPSRADAILFTECHLHDEDWRLDVIRDHDLRREFRDRTYVYNERDCPWAVLPGLYVSYPRSRARRELMRPAAYYAVKESLSPSQRAHDPDMLFCFVATPTNRYRERLFQLRHPRAIVHRSDGFVFYDAASNDFENRRQLYGEALARSKFVLCPRGAGLSSIRLYETLAAGRVPVILADDWWEPSGPEWSTFSIRWPEEHVEDLPRHLEEREDEAAEMGLRARAAYEDWFAPSVAFHRLMEALEPLVTAGVAADFPLAGRRDRRYVEVSAIRARVWQGKARRQMATRLRRSLHTATADRRS